MKVWVTGKWAQLTKMDVASTIYILISDVDNYEKAQNQITNELKHSSVYRNRLQGCSVQHCTVYKHGNNSDSCYSCARHQLDLGGAMWLMTPMSQWVDCTCEYRKYICSLNLFHLLRPVDREVRLLQTSPPVGQPLWSMCCQYWIMIELLQYNFCQA